MYPEPSNSERFDRISTTTRRRATSVCIHGNQFFHRELQAVKVWLQSKNMQQNSATFQVSWVEVPKRGLLERLDKPIQAVCLLCNSAYLLVYYSDSFQKTGRPSTKGLFLYFSYVGWLGGGRIVSHASTAFQKTLQLSSTIISFTSVLSFGIPRTENSGSSHVSGAFSIRSPLIYKCLHALMMEAGAFQCIICPVFGQPKDQGSLA